MHRYVCQPPAFDGEAGGSSVEGEDSTGSVEYRYAVFLLVFWPQPREGNTARWILKLLLYVNKRQLTVSVQVEGTKKLEGKFNFLAEFSVCLDQSCKDICQILLCLLWLDAADNR